jgi:Zn ribbon nucleic-acid-binding protein
MEDIITNFELVGTRLLRVCPVCNKTEDKKYDLAHEQAVLREQCPQCGFHFPVLEETPSSFAVFKDAIGEPAGNDSEK